MACAKKRMTMQSCMVKGDETYFGLKKLEKERSKRTLVSLILCSDEYL